MKILWICNVMLPQVAIDLETKVPFGGGWIAGLARDMESTDDIELLTCFPFSKEVSGKVDTIRYFGFDSKDTLYRVIKENNPDVVHVFGTEYMHSYYAAEICRTLEMSHKVVISIQGMVSIYAKHYGGGLPFYAEHALSFRDFIKRQNINSGKKSFEEKGVYEQKALNIVNHVIGRTDWDYACTRQINPSIKYHFCNETLRASFYENEWKLDECEKHSIFVSQCSYPIKGFHRAIEAMKTVIQFYPDAKLYTTGRNLMNEKGLVAGLKLTYYENYLKKLIKKYNLEKNVIFLGALDEKAMCERYLKSHVFVSPSSIENSPNSVGEAMILGVPTVTSDVGGVKTLFSHNVDGFIYQADAPYMLADCIIKIFESDDIAKVFSENAKKHAKIIHNRENNVDTMIKIYKEIIGK